MFKVFLLIGTRLCFKKNLGQHFNFCKEDNLFLT